MRITWIGQQAVARSRTVEHLTCLNFFPEAVESRQGKTVLALYPTPGTILFTTLPGLYGIRSMYTSSQGRLFVVRGDTLFEVFSGGAFATLGELNTGAGPINMVDNGLDLFVVDGPNAYSYTFSTATFADIVDADFLEASHVGFLDGYFVCLRPGLYQTFFWSDLLSTAFTGTNIASAEGSPDILVALLVAHREVWLFGRTTTEVWYSTGQAGAGAFARLEGALLEYGCAAPSSPALVGETLCWLAQNQQGGNLVVQAVGTNVQRISTHALESALATYSRVDDARAWGYQDQGHVYYWLSFPEARVTWVYDATAGLWHQRRSQHYETADVGGHFAYSYATAHGRHYIGSQYDGAIYRLVADAYTDAGAPIVREVTLPPVYDPEGLRRLLHTALEIDCETGVGLDGGVVPGTTPTFQWLYSDDGNHTWSSERSLPLGPLGAYRTRARARRLGSSRGRTYRLRFADPCKAVILGAYVEVSAV